MTAYFDSSVLLAILFNEERQDEAYSYWLNASTKVSSILLKIETIISLRRLYELNKQRLDSSWLGKKTKELDEYLDEVNYRIIDEEIERSIYLKKELSKCRSLDAIHIATALMYRENTNENIQLYNFDNAMHELAVHYKFETNKM
ncbi:MAG: PIN domain-containing protein [Treponema sp.]|jgi:predicted nucleic acid-binding protein|nr:PIN domain-containing protein [Treponema sp.]